MSDGELVDELIAHARDLEDADGGVNPFLVNEHDLLLKAAERLNHLSSFVKSPTSRMARA
jgi:hypothetical protein